MKIKPIHIYGGLLLLAIVFLVIFTPSEGNKNNQVQQPQANSQMPQDEVHKGPGQENGAPAPSEANVSESVRHQMEMLKKAYEKNPDDTLKAREYAEFMAAAHKPDEAIPAYERILKKYPKKTDIRFSLALIYYNRQDYPKAEEIVSQVLNYDKKNAQAKYNLGAIAASKGDGQKAKAYWEEVKAENPNTQIASDAGRAIESLNK